MGFAERQLRVIDGNAGVARGEEPDVVTCFIEHCDAVSAFDGFRRPLFAALRRIRDIKSGVRACQAQGEMRGRGQRVITCAHNADAGISPRLLHALSGDQRHHRRIIACRHHTVHEHIGRRR